MTSTPVSIVNFSVSPASSTLVPSATGVIVPRVFAAFHFAAAAMNLLDGTPIDTMSKSSLDTAPARSFFHPHLTEP